MTNKSMSLLKILSPYFSKISFWSASLQGGTVLLFLAIGAWSEAAELGRADVFEITQSGCMSGCPAYSMKIFGDGRYEFKEKYPKKVSLENGVIGLAEMQKFNELLRGANFSEFSEPKLDCKYEYSSEQSTITIKLFSKGESQEIQHDLGCKGFTGEKDVVRLEDGIEEIFKIKEKFAK